MEIALLQNTYFSWIIPCVSGNKSSQFCSRYNPVSGSFGNNWSCRNFCRARGLDKRFDKTLPASQKNSQVKEYVNDKKADRPIEVCPL